MPESGAYGSVRGALSNERPYRDPVAPVAAFAAEPGTVALCGDWRARRSKFDWTNASALLGKRRNHATH